ncbi:restriction endonuclease subunit S (plasmid) [Pseudarthrobacter sp. Fe7]|nr:restriction endonuclease subunit S [Pseudarthrobacter sp. Fe7]
MSRIDELIAEHCPGGVRYVEISRLFDLRNGYTPSKSNASFWTEGTVPWFRMEDIRANGGILDRALQQIPEIAVKGGKLFPANSLLVATSATIGEHALVTVPHLSNQRFTSLSVKAEYSDQVDMKFVYYYGFVLDEWCRNNITTSSFASVDMAGFKRFRIPVPPLEVQWEIVQVLDQFTQLEAELDAELEARRRQYEHYRSELLKFDTDTALRPLGDLAENLDRRRMPVTRDARTPGDIPYYGASGVVDYVSDFIFDGDFLLVSEDGANLLARSTPIAFSISGKTWVNNHAHVLRFDTYAERRFVEIYLNSIDLSPFISGAAQPKLNKANLNRIPIPDPSLDEKERIVGLLDRFDALINDPSIGLPAELAARRKQYEYYRDRLLTFEEATA